MMKRGERGEEKPFYLMRNGRTTEREYKGNSSPALQRRGCWVFLIIFIVLSKAFNIKVPFTIASDIVKLFSDYHAIRFVIIVHNDSVVLCVSLETCDRVQNIQCLPMSLNSLRNSFCVCDRWSCASLRVTLNSLTFSKCCGDLCIV